MAYKTVGAKQPIQFVRVGKTIMDIAYFDSVNQSIISLIPIGPFANDAAAATGGIPLKGIYYDATGIVHIRLV